MFLMTCLLSAVFIMCAGRSLYKGKSFLHFEVLHAKFHLSYLCLISEEILLVYRKKSDLD